MRHIDLATWPRREHFEFFQTFDMPHFSLCANMDLTVFCPAIKQQGISFTVAMTYAVARAANAIPEFRQRIQGDGVVEHEVVHPGITILINDNEFTFCMFDYTPDFAAFNAQATARIAAVKENPSLDVDMDLGHWLYMTAIPWVSFTSFVHPMPSPADSVPRFAWGKFFQDGDRVLLPLNVQAHHGVIDGLHVGRFYENVQDILCDLSWLTDGT